MHSSQAVIHLSNLKFNLLHIRKKLKKTKLMAVVKADAYGHGAAAIVRYYNTLGKYKPDYYGVAYPKEAVELRSVTKKAPILVLNPFEKRNAHLCKKYNLIATVFNKDHLDVLLKANRRLPGRIKVHIKVDTGMNRLGIDYDKALDFIKYISGRKEFIIDGCFTHFADSDIKDKTFTLVQLKRFNELLEKLKRENIKLGLIHAANSAAFLDLPETYFDMVRCGIVLYGYYPSHETSESVKLKPVMSLESTITTVKEVKSGETISYGRKYKVPEKTKIISVPIGYADGYWRGLSNKACVLINGNAYRQVGTVTMDRTMFDADKDDIKVGDTAILLGTSKDKSFTAWDWAKILGTIPYEITCGISKRIPRIYI